MKKYEDIHAGALGESCVLGQPVTRGYPSLTFVYEAARSICKRGRPAFLYHFGDYDPGGMDIPHATEARLHELAPDAEISFHRVAVHPEQITCYGLEARPTKKIASRSKGFTGESVEADAIPTWQLKTLAESCITRHVDMREYERLLVTEEQERTTLRHFAAGCPL